MNMTTSHVHFSAARLILQNLEDYSDTEIDAAFEVLIYSPDPSDKRLCEDAVEHMWGAPKMNGPVVLIVASFMTVCLITLSVMFVQVLM